MISKVEIILKKYMYDIYYTMKPMERWICICIQYTILKKEKLLKPAARRKSFKWNPDMPCHRDILTLKNRGLTRRVPAFERWIHCCATLHPTPIARSHPSTPTRSSCLDITQIPMQKHLSVYKCAYLYIYISIYLYLYIYIHIHTIV